MKSLRWLLLSAALLGNLAFGSPAATTVSVGEVPDQMGPTVDTNSDELVRDGEARSAAATTNRLLGLMADGHYRSRLVTVDLQTGAVVRTHLRLDPHENFLGMAHDRPHHKVYVLSTWPVKHNLYAIDTRTLAIKHFGNIQVDLEAGAYTDAEALAYDPRSETLFTAVEHESPSYGPTPHHIWTDLARIDPLTGQLSIVGSIEGMLIKAFAFNQRDGQLYGLARYGRERTDNHDVVRINPETAGTQVVLSMPYSAMWGFALKPPSSFITWINAEGQGHFYAEVDLVSGAITPLGQTEPGNYVFATLYEDFSIKDEAPLRRPAPVTFSYEGVVETVLDPRHVVGGRIVPGQRFTGEIAYDASAPYHPRYPNGHPPYGISFHLNDLDYSIEGLDAEVLNNYYYFYDHSIKDFFGLEAHLKPQIRIYWTLEDSTTRALSRNDMLPKEFNLSKWSTNEFTVIILDPAGLRLYTIVGKVDSIRRRR